MSRNSRCWTLLCGAMLSTAVSCNSGGGGTIPEFRSIPVAFDEKACAPVSLNDRSVVLLSCADYTEEESGTFQLVKWSYEGGFRSVPAIPPECHPASLIALALSSDERILARAACNTENTNDTNTSLVLVDGRWRSLDHEFLALSRGGRYLLGLDAGDEIDRLVMLEVGDRETFEEVAVKPFPSGVSSVFPTAVSDSGTAVGGVLYGDFDHSFVQFYGFSASAERTSLLAPLTRPELSSSYAFGIAGDGTVLLSSSTDRRVTDPSLQTESGVSRAVLVRPNGERVEVGPADLFVNTHAAAITNKLAVLGESYDVRQSTLAFEPFVFTAEREYVPLQTLLHDPLLTLFSYEMNNRNEVILFRSDDAGSIEFFLWRIPVE